MMKSSGLPTVTHLGRDTVKILTVAYGMSAKSDIKCKKVI